MDSEPLIAATKNWIECQAINIELIWLQMAFPRITLAFAKYKWQVQVSNVRHQLRFHHRSSNLELPKTWHYFSLVTSDSDEFYRWMINWASLLRLGELSKASRSYLCIRLRFSCVSVSVSCEINSSEEYDKLRSTQSAEVGIQLVSWHSRIRWPHYFCSYSESFL